MTYKKQIFFKLYFFSGIIILLMTGIFSCTYRKASIVSPNQERYDTEMKAIFLANCVCHVSRGQVPLYTTLAGIENNASRILAVIDRTGPVTFLGGNGTRGMGAVVPQEVQDNIKAWINSFPK